MPAGWSVWALRSEQGAFDFGRLTFAHVEEEGRPAGNPSDPTILQWTFQFGNLVVAVAFDRPGKSQPLTTIMTAIRDQGALAQVWPPVGTMVLPHHPQESVEVLAGTAHELVRTAAAPE